LKKGVREFFAGEKGRVSEKREGWSEEGERKKRKGEEERRRGERVD